MKTNTLSDIGVTSIDITPKKVVVRIKEYKKEYSATEILNSIQEQFPDYPIVLSVKLNNKRCFVELKKSK